MKKGRHRRFEEARSLKRSVATASRRCPECGAEPEDEHASWCRATEDDFDEILGNTPREATFTEDDPLAECTGQRRTAGWGSGVTAPARALRSSR